MIQSSGETDSSIEGESDDSVELTDSLLAANQSFEDLVERFWVPTELSKQAAGVAQRQFGRFLIRNCLGRGGFGIVYLAFDPNTSCEVALKIPLLGSIEETRNKERFLREAEAFSSLQHPYIVPVLETGEIDGVVYLALKYCSQGTLGSWLSKRSEPLEFRAAAALARAISQAVGYAHDHHIVHRDLKPANILLDTGSDELPLREFNLNIVPLVTDFGMAKIMGWDDSQVKREQLTKTGTRMGTPCYMPPEHATGRAKESKPTADVYNLGVILFELLTGRPPFVGSSEYEVLHQVVSRDPPDIRLVRADIPRSLEFICLKCLEKEPNRRYADANQLSEDLTCFLEGKRLANQPLLKRSTIKAFARFIGLCCFCLIVGLTLRTLISSSGSFTTKREKPSDPTDLSLDYAIAIERALPSISGLVDEKAQRSLNDPEFTKIHSENLGFEWRFAKQLQNNDHFQISHSGDTWDIAYSPDGKWMAENSNEAHTNLWNAKTETLVKRLEGHRWSTYALAFSANSRFLATSEHNHSAEPDGSVRSIQIWDLNSIENMWPKGLNADLSQLFGLTFSADNTWIYLYGSDQAGRSSVWKCRVETAEVAWKWNSTKGRVHALAESEQDGTLWLVQAEGTKEDPAISVLSLEPSSIQTIEIVPKLTFPLGIAKFSENGSFLVLGEEESIQNGKIVKLHLLDIRSQQLLGHHEEPGGYFEAMCFQRNTSDLFVVCATSIEENTIRVLRKWDAATRQFSWIRVLPPGEKANRITLHPEGETVVLRRMRDPRIYYLELDRRNIKEMEGHFPKEAWSVAFSSDGQWLLSGGDDGLARVWDANSGELLDQYDVHEPKLVSAVGFMPGQPNRVATGGFDKTIKIWDMFSDERSLINLPHESIVRKLAFSLDGKRLVTIADDCFVRSWDVEDGRLIWKSPTGIRKLKSVCVNPNGREIAIVGNDGILRILSLADGTIIANAESSSSEIWAVVYSRQSNFWLVGTNAGGIESFDGQGVRLSPWGLSKSGIQALAVSSDGKTLVSANVEGEIELWQVGTRKLIGVLDRAEQPIRDLAFSPDGERLAAALHDGPIRIWNAPKH
jgi:serine/threonine protein kinase